MEKKVMSDYTVYCTEEQTKKALELGAPIAQTHANPSIAFIDKHPMLFWVPTDDRYIDVGNVSAIPTAEQMISWLEERNSDTRFEVATGIAHTWHYYIHLNYNEHYRNLFNSGFSSRKEATLAAIDAALDYLINKKEK